jgi:hypothetical protein
MKSGRYAMRFEGFAMELHGRANHLVGLVSLDLTPDLKIAGLLRSSISPMQGQGIALTHSVFTLTGYVEPIEGEFHKATITFVCREETVNDQTKPDPQELLGTFDLLPSDSSGERYWLISTGAKNITMGRWAKEVVSGEAVRVGDIPAAA